MLIRQGSYVADQGIRWHDNKVDDIFLIEDTEPVTFIFIIINRHRFQLIITKQILNKLKL